MEKLIFYEEFLPSLVPLNTLYFIPFSFSFLKGNLCNRPLCPWTIWFCWKALKVAELSDVSALLWHPINQHSPDVKKALLHAAFCIVQTRPPGSEDGDKIVVSLF